MEKFIDFTNASALWITKRQAKDETTIKRSLSDFFEHPESDKIELALQVNGLAVTYVLTVKNKRRVVISCNWSEVENEFVNAASCAAVAWLQIKNHVKNKFGEAAGHWRRDE